eukprot:EG_transcript_63512
MADPLLSLSVSRPPSASLTSLVAVGLAGLCLLLAARATQHLGTAAHVIRRPAGTVRASLTMPHYLTRPPPTHAEVFVPQRGTSVRASDYPEPNEETSDVEGR